MAAAEVKKKGLWALVVGEDGREDLWRVGRAEGGIASRAEGCFPEEKISWQSKEEKDDLRKACHDSSEA